MRQRSRRQRAAYQAARNDYQISASFYVQVSQCVACNGLHVIVERCCRWLLMTHDRVDGDEMTLTHEFLSYMLGVRPLQRYGSAAIASATGPHPLWQGKITVLNREGLEELTCECYRASGMNTTGCLVSQRQTVSRWRDRLAAVTCHS